MKRIEEEKAGLLDTAAALERINADLNSQITALTSDQTALAKQLKTIGEENKALTGQVDGLTAEKEAISQKVEELAAEKDVLSASVDQLNAEKADLSKKVELMSQERDLLSEQADQLGHDKETLSAQAEVLEGEKAALTAQAERLESEKGELVSQIAVLSNANRELDSQISSLHEANEAMERELETAREEYARLEEANRILSDEKRELVREMTGDPQAVPSQVNLVSGTETTLLGLWLEPAGYTLTSSTAAGSFSRTYSADEDGSPVHTVAVTAIPEEKTEAENRESGIRMTYMSENGQNTCFVRDEKNQDGGTVRTVTVFLPSAGHALKVVLTASDSGDSLLPAADDMIGAASDILRSFQSR